MAQDLTDFQASLEYVISYHLNQCWHLIVLHHIASVEKEVILQFTGNDLKIRTINPTWISNHMPSKVWDEIT